MQGDTATAINFFGSRRFAGTELSVSFAMGGTVGDYNNDGFPDIYVTCLSANVLYRNNGNGTFTDVAKEAKVDDPRWSAGAAFGDYDNDGLADVVVTNLGAVPTVLLNTTVNDNQSATLKLAQTKLNRELQKVLKYLWEVKR